MARRSLGTEAGQTDRTQGAESLDQRLAKLKRQQLAALVSRLAAGHPDWLPAIDRQLCELGVSSDLSQPAATRRARRRGPDTSRLRREMRSLWRSLGPYETSAYVDVTREFADRAYSFLEKNDGHAALAVLDTITQEYVDGWFDLDDSDGEAAAYFDELGALWAEAILTADLSEADRRSFSVQLRRWQSEVADYGAEAAFGVALEALRTTGEISQGATPDLVLATLNVLERQDRLEEALEVAHRMDVHDRYLSLLIRLGRVSETQQHALRHLSQAHDVLNIARALHEHGDTQQALELGEHGLSLAGEMWTLARWLRDVAAQAGEQDVAIRAALRVLAERPAVDDYRALVNLAGDDWATLRGAVLDELREQARLSPVEVGEVLIYEGLVGEAITLADQVPTAYGFVEHVADASIASHPEWVERMARRQAERIMDGANARYYHYAIAWLKRARAATTLMNCQAEWREYVSGLLARHARKYSLVPGLKALQK